MQNPSQTVADLNKDPKFIEARLAPLKRPNGELADPAMLVADLYSEIEALFGTEKIRSEAEANFVK